MRYVGSKRRIAKEILPFILAGRQDGQVYIEPFCGGCNSLALVEGPRIGTDIHEPLIAMWKRLQEGWRPPQQMPEETYQDIKRHPENYLPEVVGFVGFGCSFGGKWFGGYARGKAANGQPRNYAAESFRHLTKQASKLETVRFHAGHYASFVWPPQSIIYCDPPYSGTQGYGVAWDTTAFWEWCNVQVRQGHLVFVSEYQAPVEWTCVWSKEIGNTLDLNTGAKRGLECLFTRKD